MLNRAEAAPSSATPNQNHSAPGDRIQSRPPAAVLATPERNSNVARACIAALDVSPAVRLTGYAIADCAAIHPRSRTFRHIQEGVIEPASPDLPPRPERQRIENPAPPDVPASPDLPPRPDPRDEERQRREEERRRRDELSEQVSYVERHAMDGGTVERAGAQLAKRRPAPTRALWDAVRETLEDHQAVTPDDEPLAEVRKRIEHEILAEAEHQSPRTSRRIPPPRPEAITEMVEALQDRADKLMRPAAEAVGLDLPPRTAAPADEQPAPPASEAPQPEQPAAAADPYKSEIAPVRSSEAGPGGVDDTVQATARDEADLAEAEKDRKRRR